MDASNDMQVLDIVQNSAPFSVYGRERGRLNAGDTGRVYWPGLVMLA